MNTKKIVTVATGSAWHELFTTMKTDVVTQLTKDFNAVTASVNLDNGDRMSKKLHLVGKGKTLMTSRKSYMDALTLFNGSLKEKGIATRWVIITNKDSVDYVHLYALSPDEYTEQEWTPPQNNELTNVEKAKKAIKSLKTAYTAMRKETEPTYEFSESDLFAFIVEHIDDDNDSGAMLLW